MIAAAILAINAPEDAPLRPGQANPVAELSQAFHAPDAEVCLLAGGDAAD